MHFRMDGFTVFPASLHTIPLECSVKPSDPLRVRVTVNQSHLEAPASGQHSRTNSIRVAVGMSVFAVWTLNSTQLNSGEVPTNIQLTPFCHSPAQHTFAE